MSRIYTVKFEEISISAVQDMIQIKGVTGKVLRILRRWVSAPNGGVLPTAQMLSLRERILTATVTDGTSGASVTPAKHDQGDADATFTALRNSTGKATTSGSAIVIWAEGCHIFNGFNDIHDDPPTVIAGQSYVWELLNAPTGSVAFSGGVEVEELG